MSEPAQYFLFITHASQQIWDLLQIITRFCYSAHVPSSFSFSEYTYFPKEKTLPRKKPAPVERQELLTDIRSLLERNISSISLDFYWNNDSDFDISLWLPTEVGERTLLICVNSNFFIPDNQLEEQVIAFVRQLWLHLQPYYGYGIVDIIEDYPREKTIQRFDSGCIDAVYRLNLFSNTLLDRSQYLNMADIPDTCREDLEDGSVLIVPGTPMYHYDDKTARMIEYISHLFRLR